MPGSIDTELLSDPRPSARPPQPPPPRINRLFDRILALLFLLAIAIPFCGAWLHWDTRAPNENRVLAPMPAVPHTYHDLSHYTDNFFAFFSDHFGFRNALIHDLQDLRFRAGFITSNDQAIVGKDGWLFLRLGDNGAPNRGFEVERGFRHFTPGELDQWQAALEKRDAYCRSRGIPYLFIIAPDKQSIYPEFMPDDLAPQGPSRIDELAERLAKTHSPVHFVDLRPALRAAKSTGELYRKTDTHWNDEGAWVGYQVILPAIQKLLPQFHLTPQPKSDFRVQDFGVKSGDLVRMLGLDHEFQEDWPRLLRRSDFTPVDHGNTGILEYDQHDPTLPRLVMIHDSFTQLLLPMLGPHFGHALFYAPDLKPSIPPLVTYHVDARIIESQKPDILVSEVVERVLYFPPPQDSPEIQRFKLPPPSPASSER